MTRRTDVSKILDWIIDNVGEPSPIEAPEAYTEAFCTLLWEVYEQSGMSLSDESLSAIKHELVEMLVETYGLALRDAVQMVRARCP